MIFKKQILFALALYYAMCINAQQPESPLMLGYDKHTQMKKETPYALDWIQVGPLVNGARAEAVQAHPENSDIIYAAFGSGGLWKTENAGLTWRPIFENMPSLGIGDIALAPSNPDIIYLGTGESLKKPRNYTMPGNGIYRSVNGGESWEQLGLDDSWHIGEIAVHPENPNIVLVAVLGHFWSENPNRGVYRTENGGKTWQHVLNLGSKIGGNDVVFAPSNPDVVYASVWENNPDVSGKGSAIYRSSDVGKTWTKVMKGIPQDKNTGRIGLAVSYQNAEKAYAFLDYRNRPEGEGAAHIFKTENGGHGWVQTHDEEQMFLSVIGWYFADIYVNPANDEEIYALGVRLARSINGGKSFEFIGGNVHHHFKSKAQTLHLDHCEMWINPSNPSNLVLANDGGIYISRDRGDNWRHANNLPTGEFYDIAVDMETPYQIYGGTQDDATVYGPAREMNLNFDDPWKYLWIDAWSGGDGCMTYVNPENPNTVYYSMQHGAIRRKSMSDDTSKHIGPDLPESYKEELKSNFIAPYLLSVHNPNRLYSAGNYVFRTNDQGDSWDVISPDLSKSSHTSKQSIAAGALAESPLDENLLFLGTDRGAFWITEDQGENWKEHSEGLPDAYIRTIYPSHHSRERVYASATGLNYDDFGTYIFMSNDLGKTWSSIQSNLPDVIINSVIEDPLNEDRLFLGTMRGVYISEDRGASWFYFGKGMPDASIGDLVIHPRERDLIVGTHGRGIYYLNLNPLENRSLGNQLFQPDNGILPKRVDSHRDFDLKTSTKLPITFWSDSESTAILTILNESDSIVWSHEMVSIKGYNQVRWDMVTQLHESPSPYFIHYNEYIKPGSYRLKLTLNGNQVGVENLEIVPFGEN